MFYNSTLGYAHDFSQIQRNTNDLFQSPWETISFNQTSLLIQPTIVRHPRDTPNLVAFFRDKVLLQKDAAHTAHVLNHSDCSHLLQRSLHIYKSTSTDDGRSWSAAKITELPNNDSAIEVVLLELAFYYLPIRLYPFPPLP